MRGHYQSPHYLSRCSWTHLYTSASIFSMVATSGWVWPEDFSRSSKACWDISSNTWFGFIGSWQKTGFLYLLPAAPSPVCTAVLPPRICPGTRTGWPGCVAFEGGPESRSRPAGQRLLRCCDEAETLRSDKTIFFENIQPIIWILRVKINAVNNNSTNMNHSFRKTRVNEWEI